MINAHCLNSNICSMHMSPAFKISIFGQQNTVQFVELLFCAPLPPTEEPFLLNFFAVAIIQFILDTET